MGRPRARHRVEKSSSPRDCAPSQTSRRAASSSSRLGPPRVVSHTECSSSGRTSRCCATRQMMRTAVRSVLAHWAARTVAHSGVVRGSPAPRTGPTARRRCTRTPVTSRGRWFDRIATSMHSGVNPERPPATSELTPSRTAPEPLSQTTCAVCHTCVQFGDLCGSLSPLRTRQATAGSLLHAPQPAASVCCSRSFIHRHEACAAGRAKCRAPCSTSRVNDSGNAGAGVVV